MVYMIGRLYSDHLLSKESLISEYPEIYDFIVQYTSNNAAPDYCRDLAIRVVNGQ
ncbi:hypothetical protein JAAARDRAFT_41473 [Jaapia argillacea MUCL 33604]|uniref:Uncharacterized protein n=1 Tax=Jaapia argillacea MUCL 33604 TaxID=933084 RepID=A0A067P7Z9_9AGAM|nr:hypothetical protein JAAARDRAFT_41473 [Jaapia argillacea MUCL 33604]